MINVDWNSEIASCEAIIKAHCEEELRANFKALLGAVCKRPDITLIFLEEFNKYASKLEEELKNVQNNLSNESKEQDH